MALGTTARRSAAAVASGLRIAGLAIVVVLVAHIVLTLLDANPDNAFAALVRGLAAFFDLGLSNLFLPENVKLAVTLNYGVAALLWFVITSIAVRLVRRVG